MKAHLPRVLGLLTFGAALSLSARAAADCETRDDCGILQSVAGIDVSRSISRTETERDTTLYGIELRQGGAARAPGGHLLDFDLVLSIGVHDQGGPPGGSIVLSGAYGRTLPLADGGPHELFAKAGLHHDFHIDRAISHYRLELPTLELGYGVYDRRILSELGLRTGFELYASDRLRIDPQPGASHDDDAWYHSHLFAPYVGAAASVIVKGFTFELSAHRVYPRSEPGARLDRAELAICASAFFVGICGSTSYLRARDSETAPEVRGIGAGITLGVGFIGPPKELK